MSSKTIEAVGTTQSMNREAMAEIIKATADPTRLGILTLLVEQGETCVCDLAGLLNEPDFKISRHLAILRKSGLVAYRRQGVWMHYSLRAAETPFLEALINLIRKAAASLPEADSIKTGKHCCQTTEPTR